MLRLWIKGLGLRDILAEGAKCDWLDRVLRVVQEGMDERQLPNSLALFLYLLYPLFLLTLIEIRPLPFLLQYRSFVCSFELELMRMNAAAFWGIG